MKIKSNARILYAGFVTVVMLLFAGEVGSFFILQLYSSLPWVDRPEVPEDQDKSWVDAYVRDIKSTTADYHPYVLWRQSPRIGKAIVIDDDGHRRTVRSQCGKNAYTIWMFGGSTMWGVGSPDWDTIPSLLAGEYAKNGHSVCVRNYAQGSWVNAQEVIELIRELTRAEQKPDLVIFYDGVNDVSTTWQFGKPDVHAYLDRFGQLVGGWGHRGSFAYVYWTNTVHVLKGVASQAVLWGLGGGRHDASTATLDRLAQEIGEHYVRNIRIVKSLAREYGFKYALFWQPVIFVEHKPLAASEEGIVRTSNRIFPGIGSLFARTYEKVRVAKLGGLFYIADVFDGESDAIYYDYAHISPKGNRTVARRIYEILRQQGW